MTQFFWQDIWRMVTIKNQAGGRKLTGHKYEELWFISSGITIHNGFIPSTLILTAPLSNATLVSC